MGVGGERVSWGAGRVGLGRTIVVAVRAVDALAADGRAGDAWHGCRQRPRVGVASPIGGGAYTNVCILQSSVKRLGVKNIWQ